MLSFSDAALKHTEATTNYDEYFASLVVFIRLHPVAKAGGLDGLEVSSDIADRSHVAAFALALSDFVGTSGEHIFVGQGRAFSQGSIRIIAAPLPQCKCMGLHSRALEAAAPEQVCPLLNIGGDLEALALEGMNFEGGDIDWAIMYNLPHRAELHKLRSFVAVAHAESLHFPGALPAGASSSNDATEVLAPQALDILDALCFATDLATLAAALHTKLSLPLSRGTKIAPTELLQKITYMLALYKTVLSFADELLRPNEAMVVDQQGWQLPIPLVGLRQWRDGMAHFGGRVQATVLSCWMDLLNESISRCKCCTPSWQGAFKDNQFLMPMALTVLDGRLAPLVRAHNVAHQLLQDTPVGGPCCSTVVPIN